MSDKELSTARPTLRTIAYLTGLGVSTVSRALKDGPEIGADTRARVQSVARQIGYRPNRAGVRLRTGKTNVVAVVLDEKDRGSPFVSQFVYGIAEGLEDTGYHLVVSPFAPADPIAMIRYIVETSSADGVILSRTQPQDGRVRYLLEHGFHVATHGRTELGLEHPYFDYDNEAFAVEALRLMAERGRRRIALIGPPPDLTYYKHTHLGFERGLQRYGLTGMPLASVNSDGALSEMRDIGRQLAAQPQRPDGIVSSSSVPAMALAMGLRDGGLEVGRDLDIVAKHESEFQSMVVPGMITIPEDFRLAGSTVAQLVAASIAGADPRSLQRVVGPDSKHEVQLAPPQPMRIDGYR
jgi:LacI family transcriptional regulator